MTKSCAGMRFLLEREVRGMFPGGTGRKWQRRAILGIHIRALSAALLQASDFRHAVDLYARTFFWHVRLMRFRYLLGFPLLTMASFFPGRSRH